MTIQSLVEELEALADRFRKEGLTYGKMAGLSELNLPPKDVPQDKLCFAYSAGAYALCAKGINDITKKVRKSNGL